MFCSHCWNGILLFSWGLISLAGGVWPFRRSIEECLWLMFWSMVYLYAKLLKLRCLLPSPINTTLNSCWHWSCRLPLAPWSKIILFGKDFTVQISRFNIPVFPSSQMSALPVISCELECGLPCSNHTKHLLSHLDFPFHISLFSLENELWKQKSAKERRLRTSI